MPLLHSPQSEFWMGATSAKVPHETDLCEKVGQIKKERRTEIYKGSSHESLMEVTLNIIVMINISRL